MRGLWRRRGCRQAAPPDAGADRLGARERGNPIGRAVGIPGGRGHVEAAPPCQGGGRWAPRRPPCRAGTHSRLADLRGREGAPPGHPPRPRAIKTRLNPKPTDIKKITVRVYSAALDLLQKVEPASPYAAKFSIPYCVATALLHGRVGLDDFTQEGIRDRAGALWRR